MVYYWSLSIPKVYASDRAEDVSFLGFRQSLLVGL